MGFNQQSVNDNGGVAWAKQVAQTMDPGAIDSQVQGYQSAISSLSSVQTTLQNVKNNLASSWSGDAAEQAQQSFQASINHTQQTQETISGAVIPALQSAKAAQQQYISTISSVPDEQPVPQNSIIDDIGSFFGSETPAQKAQNHNTAVRTQAADALNTLSASYSSSTSKLNAVGGSQGTVSSKGGDPSAYNLGTVSSSSGNGAASGYSSRVNGGGATGTAGYIPSSPTGTVNSGPNPSTTLAGTTPTQTTPPPTESIWTTSPTNTSTTPPPNSIWGPGGEPIGNEPVGSNNYNRGGLITDEPMNGNGSGGGQNNLGEEGLGKGGSRAGVFDETGMSDGELNGGTGSGMRGRTSSGDGSSLIGEEEGGAAGGSTEGTASENGMSRGMGRGGAGMGGDEEDLGSSRYSRGRYLGVEDEEGNRSTSPVRSVYDEATDADGNKVNMMGSGRRGTAQGDDEEDERRKRPSYLKEDEFWNDAQRIVPPVIQ